MRSQFIISATIFLTLGLFVANLVVAIYSGSHAVLSQALYSITDLIGGLLLLWGFRVSLRPPDYKHPFGFGKERFFWAFSATLITFSLAGLAVLVSGLQQVVAPDKVIHLNLAIIVLAGTLVSSLVGIQVTLTELRRSEETVASLLESAHQGLKTIFYQDVVTVFGSLVALAGTVVVYFTHDYVIDGITASLVGALLVVTGFVLTAETREFLVGRSIPAEQARQVLQLVERDSRVRQVRSVQSMLLGPDDALLALRVNFQDGLTTDQIEAVIDQLSTEIRRKYPVLRHLIFEPES